MSKSIQLTQLAARPATVYSLVEARAASQCVHLELLPGVFVHVAIAPSGLTFTHLEDRISIPMDELIRLVRAHAPQFGSAGEPVVAAPAIQPTKP